MWDELGWGLGLETYYLDQSLGQDFLTGMDLG